MVSILPKYYRHAEYKSFLRQLTSYGFYRGDVGGIETQRYVNADTTSDVRSILRLKVGQ